MAERNHYDVLGIPPTASEKDVAAAYRKLALHLHPDRFPLNSPRWHDANNRLKEINDAYTVLKHAQKREEYDRKLAETPWRKLEARNKAADEEARRKEEEARRKAEEWERRAGESRRRRRDEEDWHVSVRERARKREIQGDRERQGRCIMCGRNLSMMDKMLKRMQHQTCSEYVDE